MKGRASLCIQRAAYGRYRFLAFVYNALGVPVAAGVLYPFLGRLISPIWASGAMSLSSLSVVGNALRMRWVEV